jgi:DNA polymerase-1
MRPLTTPSGEPVKAVYVFASMLTGLIKRLNPDMLCVVFDSKTPTFRKEIYPEYKAHRPPMPEDMPSQIERIEQLLAAMNIPILRKNGFEADDLIGTIATQQAGKDLQVYICSKDKDMFQLLNDNVVIYDIGKDKTITAESFEKENGIKPEAFVDCLALSGDTADNIPGVADVGDKTAIKWIQKYSSLDNLIENAEEIKGKRGKNLRASIRELELSKRLVTIKCDVPFEYDLNNFTVTDFDRDKLSELLSELGFKKLMSQLDLHDGDSDKQQKTDTIQSGDIKTVKHNYQLIDTEEKFEKFYKDLKKQKIFAIDTETTSLNAMKADLVGISISFKPHTGFYIPVKGALGAKTLAAKYVKDKLAEIFADENVKKVGQNIKYDMLILRNAAMPLSGIAFDTMIASYCLNPEQGRNSLDKMSEDYLGYKCVPISDLIGKGKNQAGFDTVDMRTACEYAAEDADITYQLYLYLKQRLDNQKKLKSLFENIEMPLVEVLADMEYNGVFIDVDILRRMSDDLHKRIDELVDEIYEHTGTTFNIDSPKQLADVLFDELNLPSLRKGKAGRSTSAAVLDKLSGMHPVVDLILEYRRLSKLRNTYVDKLGTLINPRTNRVHASFNQTITATGRLSSSNPNLQNIPIKTPLGKKIRSAFTAGKKGWRILAADYSQIELRLLAHLSGDKQLIKAFKDDRDIHRFVASQIYDVPEQEVTDKMRSSCKAVNFGIIYGQGPYGLSQSIGISQAQAKEFIENYFHRYSSIKDFMEQAVNKAKSKGYVETIMARRRRIKNLNSKNKQRSSQARRLVINTLIQGSAADLIKIAMLNMYRDIKQKQMDVKMLLQIHDELVFEIPAKQADKLKKWVDDKMTEAMKLNVPLKVDIECGKSWMVD